MKSRKVILAVFMSVIIFLEIGCASTAGHTKQIAIGMLAGAATGALIGHEFVRRGPDRQYQTQNTLISAAVAALITGGVLAWHYQEMNEQQVEISGRYARYRLCNPDEHPEELGDKLGVSGHADAAQLQPAQIGKNAITLDDNTKWTFPVFRKRFLQPEKGETQLLSDRYIWEILRPGSFVTRSQNPQFFFEDGTKEGEKK